jgi:hypothetical protein
MLLSLNHMFCEHDEPPTLMLQLSVRARGRPARGDGRGGAAQEPDGGVDVSEVAAEESDKEATVHGRVFGSDGSDLR